MRRCCLRGAQFPLKVVHEEGLGVGVCAAVGVEDEDAVVFYEDAEVEEID